MPDEAFLETPPPRPPQTLRILVVEDEPDTLAMTVELLRELGHWATGVTSAELALHRYLDGAFDVLVADVGLPGLSGRDLADKLAARGDLPVIFASGRPAPEPKPRHSVWLQKPYSPEQLETALAWAAKHSSDRE